MSDEALCFKKPVDNIVLKLEIKPYICIWTSIYGDDD